MVLVNGPMAGGSGTAALVAEWSSGKVLRVRSIDQATATVEQFLTGVGKPVALAVAADGSLFVGDWASGTIHRIAA